MSSTGSTLQIETIPRVGYRLSLDETGAADAGQGQAAASHPSRRRMLAIAAGAATVAALGGWAIVARQRQDRVQSLIERGQALTERATVDPDARGAALYREALALDPQRADAWGLLALAELRLTQTASPADRAATMRQATATAERALALDPREPNGRTTLAVLRRGLDDWPTLERELVAILQAAPDTFGCLGFLTYFLQGVGRCRESWDYNERALRLQPLAPECQFKKALKYWIFGRPADADRVSKRAFELWPKHGSTWNARITVLAFTGRADAALDMLHDEHTRPNLGPGAIALWRTGLQALQSGAPADLAAIRQAAFDTTARVPGAVAPSVMLLSALGDVDSAYRVAEAVLLRRGPLLDRPQRAAAGTGIYANAGWLGTQWLFTPATAPMRDDPRFTEFCEALGYADYYRTRGIWPDAFVRGSLVGG